MRTLIRLGLTSAALAAGPAALAQDAARPAPSGTLPVREVTAFKDGHAFVMREGEMPVDSCEVTLDELPRAALGTFWPYCADGRATLTSVVAGRRPVAVAHTALSVPDLLRANVGAEAAFQETNGSRWSGRIVGFPERSVAELRDAASGAAQPERGGVMLVETVEGTKAVDVARIEGVTFKGKCATSAATEELRGRLTMRLAWLTAAPRGSARVGYVCLESGFRWIPSYRIDVDGAGKAHVKLEATLVNDLADLDRAAVHLVVGVPKFDFAGTLDPIALGADAAQVVALLPRYSRMATAYDNSIQTQVASARDWGPASGGGDGTLGDAVVGAASNEDLFVFDLKDVSLRRGERMTVPVAEFEVPYADVYTVDVPVVPPPEIWRSGRSADELERARELARPTAMHQIRLTDSSPFPITTAPAVVLRDGRVLGQGRTSYTPPGGRCDVAVTQAVGLRVRKEERETGRAPDALKWSGSTYGRVDLAGTLHVRNDADRAYEIEVTRSVLGAADSADHGGAVTMINLAEDSVVSPETIRSEWWSWFSWPWWWRGVNGASRITWKAKVEAHADLDLAYAWHYFWQ